MRSFALYQRQDRDAMAFSPNLACFRQLKLTRPFTAGNLRMRTGDGAAVKGIFAIRAAL